ncbi:MAG: 16S rRNA (cytosine(967)-C(5))-methyltransferase RsmB [Chromatiales bacterium]
MPTRIFSDPTLPHMAAEASTTRRARSADAARVRAAAARAAYEVIHGGLSLSAALPRHLEALATGPRASLCQELAYGTLRFLPRLEWFAARLLHEPIVASERVLHALILVGLYQLDMLRTPAHVAVSATVEACRVLDKSWACALVNAVLRTFSRRGEALRRAADEDPVARHAHPQWLIHAITKAWPQAYESVLAANNERPPMTLRVNRLRTDVDRYLQALAENGMKAVRTSHAPSAIRLERPTAVNELPGFPQGEVSVQDEGAQLAAALLDLKAGQRVLDACAAPGGKSALILESEPAVEELVAVDGEPGRVRTLQETLARLRLRATVITGDALRTETWWDGRRFDRILVDAPCSATGVIRRHPDIKCLRRADDVARLAATQRQLLEALWPLLAPEGKLVYATCSVLPAENGEPLRDFLAAHPAAMALAIDARWGRASAMGRQILPGETGMDGFFYALLVKR